jgi:flagellar FliJ protein
MFHFRLQKLMNLRGLTRDQRRAELAQAYEAENLLQRQRDELLATSGQIRSAMRQASRPGEILVDHLLSTHRHELVLRSDLVVLEQQTNQVAEEIERRRQALLEAEKEFRVIEKLREKLKTRHRQETEKQELRQLDEAALLRVQSEETVSWDP